MFIDQPLNSPDKELINLGYNISTMPAHIYSIPIEWISFSVPKESVAAQPPYHTWADPPPRRFGGAKSMPGWHWSWYLEMGPRNTIYHEIATHIDVFSVYIYCAIIRPGGRIMCVWRGTFKRNGIDHLSWCECERKSQSIYAWLNFTRNGDGSIIIIDFEQILINVGVAGSAGAW